MLEIERKFLLKELPDLSSFSFDEIEQGYLSFTPEIRIRRKGEKYFITEKGDGTQTREELETEIDYVTYKILSNLVKGSIIKKTRYKITLDDELTAELDVYHELLDSLFTVEVEFRSEEQANSFIAPNWFGNDITKDKRYKNKNLAQIDGIEFLLQNNDLSNSGIVLVKKQKNNQF